MYFQMVMEDTESSYVLLEQITRLEWLLYIIMEESFACKVFLRLNFHDNFSLWNKFGKYWGKQS